MGNPPQISSWRSLLCSSFLLLLFCLLCGVIFKSVLKAYLALFWPLDLEKKHKHGNTVRVKITFSLLRAVLQNWNFDLSAGNLTGKLINLGFPRLKTNSKTDFREKRQGFISKKPNWNALWRNMSHDITGNKQTRLRSQTHWKLLCISIFARTLKLLAQIASMFSCKIRLQSIFLARIINKNKN